VLLFAALAAAAPDDEVAREAVRQVVLNEGLDAFDGFAPASDAEAAFRLGDCVLAGEWVQTLLAAACQRDLRSFKPAVALRPTLSLWGGTADPVNAAGDVSEGVFGARRRPSATRIS